MNGTLDRRAEAAKRAFARNRHYAPVALLQAIAAADEAVNYEAARAVLVEWAYSEPPGSWDSHDAIRSIVDAALGRTR